MNWLNPAENAEIDRLMDHLAPIDSASAERILKEVRQIMDELGVKFFLRQGTCLGAIRHGSFIPWDDDLDIGSVFGLHGFRERAVEPVARAFRDRGFITRIERRDYDLYVPLVKDSVRVDWTCYRVVDKAVFMYPGVRIPVELFASLKEIDFLGDRFLVPDPPEEYLRLKYGEDWRVPKQAGDYEEEILELVPDVVAPGRAGRLKHFLARHLLRRRAAWLKVLGENGRPVGRAEVSVAGLGTARANRRGVARLYIPRRDVYALVVRYDGHKGLLFVERMEPGRSYTYRPGSEHLLAGDSVI